LYKFLPLENILKLWQDRLREINFKGAVSKLDLTAITDNGLFTWEDVKIVKYTFKTGRVIHLVKLKSAEGEKYNRGRGVRINIDKVMNIEQGDEMYSVIVRDLSYCGVAFVEPLGAQLDPDKEFILHLTDTDEDGNEVLVERIAGRINNQDVDENGGIFYGGNLDPKKAAFLQKYLANKQIEILRGHRLGKEVTRNRTGKFWKEKIVEDLND
jgi:hypothetical protein